MDTVAIQFATLRDILQGSGPFDAKRAECLINDLKQELLKWNCLTPKERELPEADRVRFRTILEYDAFLSIRMHNLEEFERAMSQLKCYYFGERSLPESPDMPLLLAVHLVHLLGSKKLVEFNIELQLVTSVVQSDPFIDYAVDLHQSVIDNSFARLFQLENAPPSDLFNQFTADLLNSARNNHADSIQRAYRSLRLDELSKLLYFTASEETLRFVEKRKWKLSDDGESVEFGDNDEGRTRGARDMLGRSVDLSVQISALA